MTVYDDIADSRLTLHSKESVIVHCVIYSKTSKKLRIVSITVQQWT